MKTRDASAHREPSLRDEQAERTRERILDAAVSLLAEGTLVELTVPLVAERAGVAVRTVYRYFPAKDDLVRAVGRLVDGRFGDQAFLQGGDAGIRGLAPDLFSHFEENLDLMRAGQQSTGGRQVFSSGRRARMASAEKALGPLLDGLDDEERRRALGVVYALHSSATYLYYRDVLGMSPGEAVRAISWAVGLVLDDLERQAAGRGPARRTAAGTRRGKA